MQHAAAAPACKLHGTDITINSYWQSSRELAAATWSRSSQSLLSDICSEANCMNAIVIHLQKDYRSRVLRLQALLYSEEKESYRADAEIEQKIHRVFVCLFFNRLLFSFSFWTPPELLRFYSPLWNLHFSHADFDLNIYMLL